MIESEKVRNLISVESREVTKKLLENINQSKVIDVSIVPHTNGKKLMCENECAFIFDVCKSGNEQYNVVSVIRDLLVRNHPTGKWTRKVIEPLVKFPK